MDMSERLQKTARLYHIEARKCLRGKAYLAACVMQGAALEGLLQAMCFIYPEDVKKTAVYQKQQKRGFQKKRNRALEFKYWQIINIAAELEWFPPKKSVVWGKRTNVTGFVCELQKLRNYVHPGVRAPKDKPLKFTKEVFDVVFEIFEVATDWLLHHLHKSMLKKIERAEKRSPKT